VTPFHASKRAIEYLFNSSTGGFNANSFRFFTLEELPVDAISPKSYDGSQTAAGHRVVPGVLRWRAETKTCKSEIVAATE